MWQDVKNVYHLFVAFLANLWYGFPGRKVIIVGVTGTDGKTTTVHLIHHILTAAGKHASMVSSIGAVINGKAYDTGFHVTTPSPFALQRFIKKAVGKGDRGDKGFLVLEVTSHAIDQFRIWGIPFMVGVLTNVTEEHLDYHKDYEDYVWTKMKLLEVAEVAVVNRDDRSYKLINAKCKMQNAKLQGKSKKFITYGLKNNSDSNPQNSSFRTKLIGEFNRYNILAAVAACRALRLTDREIEQGIASFAPPVGRTELVYKNNFSVIIDFAHTPNGIKQLLCSIKPAVKGRLIHVFGSAGERDRQKRPKMGRVAAKYADVVILTAEDPRSESVEKIIDAIASGVKIPNKSQIQIIKIPNRQEAINEAIRMARKGDMVVITGKGHERSMNYGRGEEPWSEHEAVKKALRLTSFAQGKLSV